MAVRPESDTAAVERRGGVLPEPSRHAGSDTAAAESPGPQPLAVDDPTRLGSFQLVARLGQDAAEVVYLGKSGEGRWVAVTVLHPDLRELAELRARFAEEALAVAGVRSPHVAEVVGVDVDSAVQYAATEFVFGPSVADDVAANGPLPAEDLRSFAVELCEALAAFHRAGISHLALTPHGIVRSTTGAKLADLGLSRAAVGFVPDRIWAGTPMLWAPELWAGDAVDPGADVWAWACLVAFAGTGRHPFVGAGLPGLRQATLRGRPSLDGLDEAVRSVVSEALRKDPATRPSCADIVARLRGGHDDRDGPDVGEGNVGEGAAVPGAPYAEPRTMVLRRPYRPPVFETIDTTLTIDATRFNDAARLNETTWTIDTARLNDTATAEHYWRDTGPGRGATDGADTEGADTVGGADAGLTDAGDRDGGDRDGGDRDGGDRDGGDRDGGDDPDWTETAGETGWQPRGSRRHDSAVASVTPGTGSQAGTDSQPGTASQRGIPKTRQAGPPKRKTHRARLVVGLVVAVVTGAVVVTTWRSGASEPAGEPSVVAAALAQAAQLKATDPDLARRIELAAYGAEPGPATETALLAYAQRSVLAAGGEVTSVAFSPDGRTVVAGGVVRGGGGSSGVLQLWEVDRPDARRIVHVEASAITNVRVSPDGMTLAASGSDVAGTGGVLWLWKLTDLENPRGFTTKSPTIDGLAYGPDGTLVTDGDDNALAILDVEDAGHSSLLLGHTGPVNDIAFRPDGGAVASASSDGTIRVWSFGDPANPVVLAGHAGPVTSVAFSADGATLASAGQDGAVLLWDLNAAGGPSSRVLTTVPVAPDVHPRVAFSPVGRVLAVPTSQGPVRTWDLDSVAGTATGSATATGAATGTERVFTGHEAAAAAVAFSADGARLASGGLDHSVRIWDLRPEDVVNRLCADPASHLTEQEKGKYFPGTDVDLPCG